MILLFLWMSTVLLAVSALGHVAALCGTDLMTEFPYIWILHVLIFAVAIPTICYAKKYGGEGQDSSEKLLAVTPLWIKILTGILFGYAIVNFCVAVTLMEGAGPDQREDGSFVLSNHGRVIRQLTEQEYRRYRSYESRLFTGHCMGFYSVFVMLLLGARRMRQRIAAGEPAEPRKAERPPKPAEKSPPRPSRDRPVSGLAALTALGAGVGMVMMVRTHRFELSATAALVSIMLGVWHLLRQRHRKQMELFETAVGCLCLLPSLILAIVMTWYLQWFVYVAVACGPREAVTGAVTVVYTQQGPHTLSNGEVVDGRLLTGLQTVVWPVGVLFGATGLIYLADVVGRYLQKLRWRKARNPCPHCGAPLRTAKAQQCLRCGADWHGQG